MKFDNFEPLPSLVPKDDDLLLKWRGEAVRKDLESFKRRFNQLRLYLPELHDMVTVNYFPEDGTVKGVRLCGGTSFISFLRKVDWLLKQLEERK